MSSGPEWEQVERPLLEHLFSLGWETLNWSQRQADGVDLRSSDRDVLLERRLGSALEKINRGPDGKPWLDGARIGSAVADLRSMQAGAKLLEANRLSTELLLGGVTVAGLTGWDRGRDQVADYIDWDDWEANDFLAVSQFTVATPGRAPNIRPDVTLFVNGIPLVVIEAKPPGHDSGITDAIDPAPPLRQPARQRGRRGRGAVVLDEPVHRRHYRRGGPRRRRSRRCPSTIWPGRTRSRPPSARWPHRWASPLMRSPSRSC